MTDGKHNPSRKRFYIQAAIGLILLAAFVTAAWYVSSPQFKSFVKGRIIASIEDATGGRAEIGQLRWTLWKLEFEARDITVHGLEGRGEIPYLHADRVYLKAKIISAIRHKVGLRFLELDHPVVHLIVYPDGTTNQPTPKRRTTASSTQPLFDMAADTVEVRNGEVRINDRPIPVDFTASDVAAAMAYDAAGPRYHGDVHVGKIDTKFKEMRPLSAIADARFSLSGHTLHVTSMTLKSGDSHVEASGYVQNLATPVVDVNYRATLDLREAGAISRTPQLKDGTLRLEGRGTYTSGTFTSTGKLAANGLDWIEKSVRIRNANVVSDFQIDNRKLLFPNLSIRTFGGSATGNLEVVNWRAGEQPGGPAQRGTLRLRVAGFGLNDLAAATSSRTLPLDRMNLAGTTSGTVAANWTGQPSNIVADLDVVVSPPVNPTEQQIPVTATLRGRYNGRAGVLDVTNVNVSTRATHIEAAGTLGSSRADLHLAASTSNIGELMPLIAAQGQLERLPLELHGRATFSGAVAGKFSQPSIAGELQVTNFESLLASPVVLEQVVHGERRAVVSQPEQAPTRVRRMHWDSLSTTIQYSPSLLALHKGILRRGAAQISFGLNVQLRRGHFTDASPFTANVHATNAQAADLQTLAGYNYPVSGTVDFDLTVSGTQTNPHGKGHVAVRNAIVYGQPVSHAVADINFAGGEAQFNNIDISQNGARVFGAAAYNLNTRAYRFRIRGDNFALAKFSKLQTHRLTSSGFLNFDADGSGTPEAPLLNANVKITDLAINGERVGNMIAQARTVGETLTLTARSNVSNADLILNGTVRLRDDFPAVLSARFVHLDLDPVLQAFLGGRMTGHSAFAGNIDVRGPLRNVLDMKIEGELSQFYVPVESIHVRNQGPIVFGIAHQVLEVKAMHLLAEDTDFTATGTAELSGERRLNFAALGNANLKLVQSLNPDYVSYGSVTMDVQVGGTAANPLVNGRLQIAKAGISYIDLPNGLSDINGTMVFNRDRLQIQQMTASTGGGTLALSGYVTYAGAIGFNIQAAAKDIRLRYPPGVSAMADANVRLSGTLRNSLLSGDVTVTRFGLNPRFDFALYLARSKRAPELTNPKSPLNNLRLDLHVTSTPELQVQTSLAKLSGNVDLRLRGTAARPAVLGRVDIVEGDVFFNGTKYHVERGDITFTNPTRVEPVLDIEATTRVRDYDITLGFHGPVDKLSTTYRSDPPLATADIIALLAFGRTREESAMQPVSSQNFTETASNAILGQALNATVSSRVQKLFGVSRIKIDPQVGGAENNPSGARVTIEQQVANNLTITYITDLARSNQQIISVEYNVTRAVSVLAVRDQNGIVSFDVRIRQRKR